jgi:diguanylate cyclase (GGDEF)-like protein/PAS domain S-box-containing protein
MARREETYHAAPADPSGLPWYRRLQWQFWLLGTLLLILLAVAGWQLGRAIVYETLTRDVFLYETESGRRLQTRIAALTDRAEVLAATLAELAASAPRNPAEPTPAVTDIVDVADPEGRFASIGIWPLPEGDGPRRSRVWLRDAVGELQPRDDYNDARVVSYANTAWFAAARYVTPHRCYWSPVRVERLSQESLVSCSTPILRDGRFAGTVTVGIRVDTLEAEFERSTAGDPGYSVLLDGEHRVLALSGLLAGAVGNPSPATLAALAQAYPALNPLSVSLFNQRRDFRSEIARSPAYDVHQISALEAAAPSMTRADAEAALVPLWARLADDADRPPPPKVMPIADDTVLQDDANATVLDLRGTGWTLVRVRAAREGFSGARALFQKVLWFTVGSLLIAMLVMTLVLQLQVLRPLRRMSVTLSRAGRLDESLDIVLDASRDNELGVLAHVYNDRTRQLRELMDSALNANAQLTIEATQRRELQLNLDALQQRHLVLLGHSNEGLVQTDAQGRIEHLNPAAEQLSGFRSADVRGRPFGDVFSLRLDGEEEPLPDLVAAALERRQTLTYHDGARLTTATGEALTMGIQVVPVRAAGGRNTAAVAILRPLQSATATSTVAETAAPSEDPLTGLPGRAACEQHLRSLLHAAQLQPREHALLIIDLDHFERVNSQSDTMAGNECLQRVADTLRQSVGRRGRVYRMVSDQFAVVLEAFDLDRARIFADALREAIGRQQHSWSGRELRITASIGLARLHGDSDAATTVVREADDACRAAKREGRNRVRVFDPTVSRGLPTVDDALWVRRIRAGIDEDRFHLTTQYIQPAGAKAEIAYFEVLLALEDEEGFWASPDAFAAVAHRHGLTVEMDRWVVSRTLGYLQRTPDVLTNLGFVLLNLSPATMADPDWLHWLVEQLESHPEVPPRVLCFELRQTTLLEHPKQAATFCDAMRALGCRVSVDHFAGADRNALPEIRSLAVDLLKINAQHYRQLTLDPVEQLLAESAVKVARTLQKDVVVFNVEDSALVAAWQRIGVDFLQGHAVAKPTPVIFSVPRR